jgi:hypothetical protein
VLRIDPRADDARRFVEKQVSPVRRLPREPAAVHTDFVLFGIRFRAELGNDAAIYLYASLSDQFLGDAT